MARKHRVRFCGATYHVMSRGNRKARIFLDDVDRRRFLKIVGTAIERYGAMCFAYCLMDNHFHLIIHTPRANISRVMQHIDGLYTQYENWRQRTTGHVFEGRFTGIVIDDTTYLRNAIAYVLRNPREAGLVADPAHWKWSSYKATMGKCACPDFLTLDWLEPLYEADSIHGSRALLTEHVMKDGGEYADLVRSVAEGTPEFRKRVRAVIGATMYRAELPRSYRALARPSLTELFAEVRKNDRRTTILRAHVVHGYLLTEIANHLELHLTTISRIVNQTGSYRLTRD